MTVKLVYNGTTKASFMSLNAELSPGDEFYVPDDQAASFLQRGDISVAMDHDLAESEDLAPTTPDIKSDTPAKKTTAPKAS
jgi:hypothetical protein